MTDKDRWPEIKAVCANDLKDDPIHKYAKPGENCEVAGDVPSHLWPINAEALDFVRAVLPDMHIEINLINKQLVTYDTNRRLIPILPAFIYT